MHNLEHTEEFYAVSLLREAVKLTHREGRLKVSEHGSCSCLYCFLLAPSRIPLAALRRGSLLCLGHFSGLEEVLLISSLLQKVRWTENLGSSNHQGLGEWREGSILQVTLAPPSPGLHSHMQDVGQVGECQISGQS